MRIILQSTLKWTAISLVMAAVPGCTAPVTTSGLQSSSGSGSDGPFVVRSEHFQNSGCLFHAVLVSHGFHLPCAVMRGVDGGVLVGPKMMRQVFNDTDEEVLWLILGAPEKEFEPGESFNLNLFWPVDPKQLPKELAGVVWPPQS